ncbi:uncharacterized protein LOC111400164 [Olea europaea var. sylvestris]|uniref:uncharacterized protein LOC111400164 n=1 Tax=Olea europaea var. sylvestris TaxID=158386 RepID=UPI000C1D6D29|nr:uncharacterized protein LOC111400164 [Olea europaea var. sylvestris]
MLTSLILGICQQQNPLLQQFTSQSSSVAPQLSLGVKSAVHQPSNHQAPISTLSREADARLTKVEELQEQQAISEGLAAESGSNSVLGKNLMQEDELKPSYTLDAPVRVCILLSLDSAVSACWIFEFLLEFGA